VFRKNRSERCLYLHCRKFLQNDYMHTGMCKDCAVGAIKGIKKYFMK